MLSYTTHSPFVIVTSVNCHFILFIFQRAQISLTLVSWLHLLALKLFVLIVWWLLSADCLVHVPSPLAVEGVLVYYEKEEDLGPLVLGSCPGPQFLLQDYQPLHSVLGKCIWTVSLLWLTQRVSWGMTILWTSARERDNILRHPKVCNRWIMGFACPSRPPPHLDPLSCLYRENVEPVNVTGFLFCLKRSSIWPDPTLGSTMVSHGFMCPWMASLKQSWG